MPARTTASGRRLIALGPARGGVVCGREQSRKTSREKRHVSRSKARRRRRQCPPYPGSAANHDDSLLLKHIRRGHAIYASRREQLLAAFAGPLAPWFSLVPATAGFHLAARATAPVDIAMLIRLARRAVVGLYPLADFFQDSAPEPGLFLGYGAIDTLNIEPALLRVRDILQQMA